MNEGRWCGCFTPLTLSLSYPQPAAAAAAAQQLLAAPRQPPSPKRLLSLGVQKNSRTQGRTAAHYKHKSAGAVASRDFIHSHTCTLVGSRVNNTHGASPSRTKTKQISMEKEFNKPFVSSVGKDESSRLWIQAEKVSEGKIKMKILMRSAEKAWTAELTDATASKYYTQYSLSAKDYWNAILSELLSPSEHFSISVRNEKVVFEKLGSNQIRLVYAKVDVEEAPFLQCLLSMTETLLETQTELRKSNNRLEKKIVDVTEDKDILQEQLEKFTEDAVTKEELLLSNFLAVLNAKKEKIQRLQGEIEGKGEYDGSPAENEYDADTDVDEGQDTPPKDQPSSSSRPEKARKTDLRDNFDDVMDLYRELYHKRKNF